jgi:AcrR family transcriptional regulator
VAEKMDARVRYTNMVIKDSFFQLLREKPLSKITVTAICEKSQINRATFYKYYADPYDLLQQIEAELILELQKLIENANTENVTETLVVMLDKIKENGEIYAFLFSEHGDSSFISQIFSLCYQTTQSRFIEMLPAMDQNQLEWFYYFLVEGSSSIMNRWVQNGMKEESLEVAQFINGLTMALFDSL